MNNEQYPAIGMIELSSIAKGIITADYMVKKAPITLIWTKAISRGKFLILITGDEASVDESLQAGVEAAGDKLLDMFYIPQVHSQVSNGLKGDYQDAPIDSLGVIETETVASSIIAADYAVKAADVILTKIHLGTGIGGKAYFILTGPLFQIEAAVQAGRSYAEEKEKLTGWEIIPAPFSDLGKYII